MDGRGAYILLALTPTAIRAIVVGGVLMLAILLVGVLLLPWLRRRYHPSAGGGQRAQARGFSMEGLEAMRRSGQISEEEFRALRRAALGLAVGKGKTENSASSTPTSRDDDDNDAPDAEGGRRAREGDKEQR